MSFRLPKRSVRDLPSRRSHRVRQQWPDFASVSTCFSVQWTASHDHCCCCCSPYCSVHYSHTVVMLIRKHDEAVRQRRANDYVDGLRVAVALSRPERHRILLEEPCMGYCARVGQNNTDPEINSRRSRSIKPDHGLIEALSLRLNDVIKLWLQG